MPLILPVHGVLPAFGENCFLAENATVVGDVVCGRDCSFWFQSVVRGDVHRIRMGDAVNVQDGAVIHCTYQKAPTTIGHRVSIGHRAIVHGCTLEDDVLVGMGAIVMDHAVVRAGALIAAGAVVLENTVVEAGAIYAGVPARKVKQLDPDTFRDQNQRIAGNYIRYADWFRG
jgi:carbonic anhydrase/acetyltransferase-like protein (isoleucine patch superfamily)